MDGRSKATPMLRNRLGKLNTQLNCLQINLQHSRLATENLVKIIEEEGFYILCVQETYTIGKKMWVFREPIQTTRQGKEGNGRQIVINNKQIDTILITQISDEDVVVLETRVDFVTFIIASMYIDITRPIYTGLLVSP